MNEFTNYRPPLDDFVRKDWNLAFSIFAPDSENTIESHQRYAVLANSIPSENVPMLSLAKGEVIFSLRVGEATQKQAVMIGFSNIVTAFERANLPLTIKSARMASRFSIEQAMRDDTVPDMIDISLEVIDLERSLTIIRDIE